MLKDLEEKVILLKSLEIIFFKMDKSVFYLIFVKSTLEFDYRGFKYNFIKY